MNQNKNVRQISPEEVEKATRMSTEELQKTQVLNLNEVQKTIRFEKLTSKKPALVIAAIGLLSLTFGTTYQITDTIKINKQIQQRQAVPQEKVKEVKKLNCVKTTLNNPDGTDTVYTINYKFEDDSLIEISKSFNVVPIANNKQAPTTIEKYKKDNEIINTLPEGYQISLSSTDTGITINTYIDFNKLDLTKIDVNQKKVFYTDIDYPKNTEYEKIRTEMLNSGFTVE